MFELILAIALTLPAPKSDATIGVSAHDLVTGKRIELRGGEHFPMGSVYKFPIALTVLHLVDRGQLRLDAPVEIGRDDFAGGWSPLRDETKGQPATRTVRQLVELMVKMSDNTASDVLLRLAGGPAAVTRHIETLGVHGVRVDRSEKAIHDDLRTGEGEVRYANDPRDSATPRAMTDLLELFWSGRDGLKAETHAILMTHLANSPTGERKLRAALPAGWKLAHKSGMMPRTSNDVGVLTSPDGKHVIVISIFAKGSTSSYENIDADVAAATRRVLEQMTE